MASAEERFNSRTDDPEEIFLWKVTVGHEGDHWSLEGSTYTNGYSRITTGYRKRVLGHRLAYEIFVGPIPPGLVIDHRYRKRWCVNPYHLEPVTNAENIRRAFRTCGAGLHDLTDPANQRAWRGRTQGCLPCKVERDKNRIRSAQ